MDRQSVGNYALRGKSMKLSIHASIPVQSFASSCCNLFYIEVGFYYLQESSQMEMEKSALTFIELY